MNRFEKQNILYLLISTTAFQIAVVGELLSLGYVLRKR